MVVVGSANADYVVRVERRPGPGETVGGASFDLHAGGKGANQAVAAARCGAAVDLVACVGDDALGAARIEELDAAGVGTSHVLRTAGAPTGAAFVVVTPDGENSIVVAPGANWLLGPSEVEHAASLIAGATVLVVQLEIPTEGVARAVELAAPAATVLVNCAPFRPLPDAVLDRTDVLVANETEAAALAGWPVATTEDAREAARRIVAAGPRLAVVTLGPAGALAVGAHLDLHVPAPRVRVLDTTGAGDALVGAMAARLASGAALEEAVAFGVAVGSATTERLGASAIVPG
ncbi:MAG TPA: ribokinase [Acidimicrobiales bacterium]|nr:ribokinase [Acidimicrobiales bacterium]